MSNHPNRGCFDRSQAKAALIYVNDCLRIMGCPVSRYSGGGGGSWLIYEFSVRLWHEYRAMNLRGHVIARIGGKQMPSPVMVFVT